jgi:hypothetical protein
VTESNSVSWLIFHKHKLLFFTFAHDLNSPRPRPSVKLSRIRVSCYQNDAGTSVGLMSRPCRTFRGKRHASGYSLWAIIIPPPNEALADPSLPLYSALSPSHPLPFLPLSPLSFPLILTHGSLVRLFTSSLCLLAWDPNFIPRYHIWATHLLSAKTLI